MAGDRGRGRSGWRSAVTAIKVTALIGFTAIVGVRVIPRVLDYVADTRSRELFTLTVLVIALGIAVGSSLIFSVSMALGAFLAGMVVGRSEYSLRAASEALPMRDAFAVLFFVSVGMLLDPAACSWLAGPAHRRAGGRSGRQAAGGDALRLGDAIPFKTSLTVGDRARADRRVLVHPGDHRTGARHPDRRGDQHARGRVDRVDRVESAGLSNDPSHRAMDCEAAAMVGAY